MGEMPEYQKQLIAESADKVHRAKYTCPVCGSNDPDLYLRCNRGDCTDGRDRPFRNFPVEAVEAPKPYDWVTPPGPTRAAKLAWTITAMLIGAAMVWAYYNIPA